MANREKSWAITFIWKGSQCDIKSPGQKLQVSKQKQKLQPHNGIRRPVQQQTISHYLEAYKSL